MRGKSILYLIVLVLLSSLVFATPYTMFSDDFDDNDITDWTEGVNLYSNDACGSDILAVSQVAKMPSGSGRDCAYYTLNTEITNATELWINYTGYMSGTGASRSLWILITETNINCDTANKDYCNDGYAFVVNGETATFYVYELNGTAGTRTQLTAKAGLNFLNKNQFGIHRNATGFWEIWMNDALQVVDTEARLKFRNFSYIEMQGNDNGVNLYWDNITIEEVVNPVINLTVNLTEEVTESQVSSNCNITTYTGMYNITSGYGTVYDKIGNNTWKINCSGYVSLLETQEITINATINISVYDTDVNITNAISGDPINPVCVYGSYNITSPYTFNTINNVTDLNCTLNGYSPLVLRINNDTRPQEISTTMNPYAMALYFSHYTDVVVNWMGGGATYLNVSEVLFYHSNVSIGYVDAVFNAGQQLFSYYNNGSIFVNQTLYVMNPDLVQTVKVSDGIEPIEEARVSVYVIDNDTWVMMYSDYTNGLGRVNVMLNDSKAYKFVASADGYTSNEVLQYIEDGSTEIVTIILNSTETEDNMNYYGSTCSLSVGLDSNCTISVISTGITTLFAFNYTIANGSSYYSTVADSQSAEVTMPVTNLTGDVTLRVYINGLLKKTFLFDYVEEEAKEVRVTITDANQTWIASSNTRRVIFFIMFFILAIVIAGIVETRINGGGIHAFILVCLLFALVYTRIAYWLSLIILVEAFVVYKLVRDWWGSGKKNG